MKNRNSCIKCGLSQIIRIPGDVGMYGAGNNIIKGHWIKGNLIKVLVTRYLCASCGYSEEWVENKEGIRELKEKYGILE